MPKTSLIRSAVSIEHRLVRTDGRTDRHRPMASTADALHRAVKYLANISDILQSYRDIAGYVAGPHTLTRFVVRLELQQRGVGVATRSWLNSQLQCMVQAFSSEIHSTVTFGDSGIGVVVVERKIVAKCRRNSGCHGNVYF